jgi:branched-chain amino acid transport system ATP-binding protein
MLTAPANRRNRLSRLARPHALDELANASGSAHLQLTGLVTGYAGARILDGVDLVAKAGEVTVILGRNGAGKTTMLKCLSGLVPVWQGALHVDGVDITALRSYERVAVGITHVPEGRRMIVGLNVRENLLVGGYVVPRKNLADRLDEVVELFPVMKDWLDREATSLSGGQQQLVAAARALMAPTRILLLDEPFTGLSPSVASEVFDVLVSLRSRGLTILLVEQNAHLALDLADSVYVLDMGKVAEHRDAPEAAMAQRIESVYLGLDE